ncbi:MAG: quinone-dependent dihydroorotate dehydrogenase [Anaerolineae bacterium]
MSRRAVRQGTLTLADLSYRLTRPLIFRLSSAQQAHERMLAALRWADGQRWLIPLLGAVRSLTLPPAPVPIGGVLLESPLILAAGLVKGDGFASEDEALAAVRAGRNIMPGWRSLPALVGLVEFGSFTRWPRLGNPGVVTWRDVHTRSTQNRVGLRNPGARAAALFLAERADRLPRQFGINVAVSPGVSDAQQQTDEVLESLSAFLERGVIPTWFTLNLSCPNTEDDPRGHQTADEARQVCRAAIALLREATENKEWDFTTESTEDAEQAQSEIPSSSLRSLRLGGSAYLPARTAGRIPPLWVKVGPNLGDDQYRALLRVFAETGVGAVVATNTLPMPAPGDPTVTAGVGGGRLFARALEVVALLQAERAAHGYPVDVIACGGIQDGATFRAFAALGIAAMQYWTALVYRGPLAAALIAWEGEV